MDVRCAAAEIEQLYRVAKELSVSMEALCFAASDNELLAKAENSSASTPGLAGNTFTISPAVQAVFSTDEIKGRFEIHLRRITDD